MKTNIKINVLAKEITMTKATAKRASLFGTTEYEHLVQAMKDFPNFEVKILSPKTRDSNNKGLTMPLMTKLVKEMSNNSPEDIKAFHEVVKCYENSSFHFSKPKAYFLSEYPNWREWLPQVEERQQEQSDTVTAVEEREQKEDSGNKSIIQKLGVFK